MGGTNARKFSCQSQPCKVVYNSEETEEVSFAYLNSDFVRGHTLSTKAVWRGKGQKRF